MYPVGMTYRASQTSRFLPVNTIAEGTHVGLDVKNCKLRLAKAMPDSSVLVEEYAIRNIDDALDFFAYLQRNKERFRSTKII